MTMKKLEKIICAIMLLSLVGTAALIALSPETVPAHYNFAGEVDRMGSRYEALVWPIFVVVMGLFFLAVARYCRKKGETGSEKFTLYTGICITLFEAALGFYFTCKGILYDPAAVPQAGMDQSMQFVGVAIGVLLVVLGNVMPKARRNAFFGLRTKWSMASDSVWQRSQRFGGISGVICGLAMIVLSIVAPGMWNLLAMTAVTVLWVVLCVAASYRFYREEQSRPQS